MAEVLEGRFLKAEREIVRKSNIVLRTARFPHLQIVGFGMTSL
jgi:hypothetical protein